MNRRSFGTVGPLFAAAIVASWAVQAASQPAARTSESKIPFDVVLRHIVLPVNVDHSRPLSFILDTGDKFAVIDLDRAKELGLQLAGKVDVQGVGAQQTAGAWVQRRTMPSALRGRANFSKRRPRSRPAACT